MILEDPRIRSVSAGNLAQIVSKDYWWPKPGDFIYRPVTTLSFLVNYAVLGNGSSPAGYHWINFLLHALNVCLVYELAVRLLARPAPAFFAAALWAVHPIATEAVDNVVGRADLLATLAVLSALLLYLRGTRPVVLFAISAFGCFSKESAAVLPGLMLVCDLAFGVSRTVRARVMAYAAAVASLALLFAARAAVFARAPWPQMIYTDNILRGLSFWQARFTAIKVIGLDLWLLICPLHLSSDRSYNQIAPAGPRDIAAWAALAAVAGLLVLAFAMRRRSPLIFGLAGFFGVALVPVSNLVILIGSTMAERFLYLPSVAFAIAIAALAWRYLPRRAATCALGAAVLLCAGRTWARNADWQDNLTLGIADTKTAPASVRLHDMLAKAYFEQDAVRNIDRAIREQETAWAILSPLPPQRSAELPPANLGAYYFAKAQMAPPDERRGWYEKSVAVLLRAREISRAAERSFDQAQISHGKPLLFRQAYPLLYLFLAEDYLNLGRYAEAIEALKYARMIDPRNPDLYDSLAKAYQASGQSDWAAISLVQKALIQGSQPPAAPAAYCLAAADLAQAFRDSRAPGSACEIQAEAARRFGCPEPVTDFVAPGTL
jgi:tetratricopeptide (TPR) repeat protein